MPGPSKEVRRHLNECELADAIDDAQRRGEARLVRRLILVKILYAGDSVTAAAERVGVSQPTASRWTDRWNDDAVDGLRPRFGGGRPPKLSEDDRERLGDLLERHQPLPIEHVQRLLESGFGISYSRRHLARVLEELEVGHAIAHPESSVETDDAREPAERRLRAALEELH